MPVPPGLYFVTGHTLGSNGRIGCGNSNIGDGHSNNSFETISGSGLSLENENDNTETAVQHAELSSAVAPIPVSAAANQQLQQLRHGNYTAEGACEPASSPFEDLPPKYEDMSFHI